MNNRFFLNPWRRLKLTGKFRGALGLLLILAALMVITSLVTLATLRHRTEAAINTSFQMQQMILEAEEDLSPEFVQQIENEIQKVQAEINRAGRLASTILMTSVIIAIILASLITMLLNTRKLRNLTAGKMLRQQNDYLSALHETTIALVKNLDLDELLEDIIIRAGQLLGTPHGYLYLVEPGQSRIERKIGVGHYAQQPPGFYLAAGEGLAGKVWQRGAPLMINDCANWPERSARADYEQIRALAGVPLKFKDDVIGVIGMAYDVETEQTFGDKELALLNRFAELASLALNNARLYAVAQKEKQRSDNLLNVVIPIGVALSAEQNFDRLLEKILLEAKHFCHADAGTLYLRTENDELKFVILCNDTLQLIMGGTSGIPINFPPILLYDKVTGEPNHNNVAAYVALTGASINIPDAYEAAGFNFSGTKAFDAKTGYRSTSFLTTPLKNAHNQVVGVLQLINAKGRGTGEVISFDPALEQITNSLSSLATVALEAYIREQSLRQQIRQLRIEIDEAKRQQQVDEIVETDFFQDLQDKARQIRRRFQR